MKKILSICLAIAVNLSLISFGLAQPASNSPQADNQFAFDLYSRLASDKGNIFFSPYSLSSALDMAYEGARGATAKEMSSVLHFNADDLAKRAETLAFIQQINRPDKTYKLAVANAFWTQKAYPFKDDYLNLVKNTYFAEARNLNFVLSPEASRQTINGWVSDKTKNRINDLLPLGSITSNTSLVLTDAVYFKGKWFTPFKKEDTKLDTFWLTPAQSVQTDMMALEYSFNYIDNDQVQVLQIPYQGNDLSMVIILPRSKDMDIQGLEKVLTNGKKL